MKKNLIDIIRDANTENKDDYVIQEGIILNRTFLIDNGLIDSNIKFSTKFYPIYIPGKHPTNFGKTRITLNDIFNKDSVLYNNSSYFEIGTHKEDGTKDPQTGQAVRIYYNKASDKRYSKLLFEIIEPTATIPESQGDISVNIRGLSSSFTTPNQSVASYSGGNVKRGILTSFSDMFSQPFGKIILLRGDELAINTYACAGQESSWYSGAIGDAGKSFGWFQMHTKVHTPKFIQEYIDIALNYFKIKDLKQIKLSDLSLRYTVKEWETSVGFPGGTYPIKQPQYLNCDVQLLVWYGYMTKEKYINRLSTVRVFDDIENYQKAQRFAMSLIEKYKTNTMNYYFAAVGEKNKRFNELDSFRMAVNNETSMSLYLPTPEHKYVAEYINPNISLTAHHT